MLADLIPSLALTMLADFIPSLSLIMLADFIPSLALIVLADLIKCIPSLVILAVFYICDHVNSVNSFILHFAPPLVLTVLAL